MQLFSVQDDRHLAQSIELCQHIFFHLWSIVGIDTSGQSDSCFSHGCILRLLLYSQDVQEPCHIEDIHDDFLNMDDLHSTLLVHCFLGREQNTQAGR